MVVGLYALAFALVASRIGNDGPRRAWWAALERAVWIKSAWLFSALPAWGLVVVAELRGPSFLVPFFAAFVLDDVTGGLSTV